MMNDPLVSGGFPLSMVLGRRVTVPLTLWLCNIAMENDLKNRWHKNLIRQQKMMLLQFASR